MNLWGPIVHGLSFQETTFFKSGVYTIRPFFIWHHGSLFHVENNETAGRVSVQRKPCVDCPLFACKNLILLFRKIFIDADHVNENDSHMMILYQKRKFI